MKIFSRNFYFLYTPFMVVVLCLPAISTISFAEGFRQKKVFVVHSYHESQKGHVIEMTEGIIEALKECQPDVRFFHMDTKRKNSLEWKISSGNKASQLMYSYKPDVVIAMDDNAQSFFVKKHSGQKNMPSFVFGGVNAEPSKYGFPADNVTGVLERPNIKESIEFLLKIKPDVRKIVLLSDKSPTTDLFHEYSNKISLPVEVIAREQPETVDEWIRVVQKYKDVADAFGVYVIRTIRDTRKNVMADEKELLSYLTQETRKPTVGFFDSAAKAGALCGISVSMMEQGYASGKIACEIIKGKKPSDISVEPTTRGRILLNLETAEFLGIDIGYTLIKNAHEVIRKK